MYVAMLGVMENRKHLLSPGSDRGPSHELLPLSQTPRTTNTSRSHTRMQQRRAYAYLGAVWGAILVSRGQVPDTTQNKSYGCLETQMEKLKAPKAPGLETCSVA